MNAPDLDGPPDNRKGRLYKAGLVTLGLSVLALGIVAAWVTRGPSERALDPRSTAEVRPASTFAPHASRHAIANVEFEDGQGRKRTLADFRGKVVLLNVWATWCTPCRAEMPTLDRLQQRLGGADFEVVALSIDRGGQAAVKSFFDEIDVRALAIYVDSTAEASGKLGAIGVPTTLLIDREGREVARYTGPKEWDRPEVIEIIEHYLPEERK